SDAGVGETYSGISSFTADQALWTGADTQRAGTTFADAARVARDHGVRLRLPRLGEPGAPAAPDGPGCSWPWDAAYVTSAGVVQPCCMVMGDDRVALGRLSEHSFTDIWYGDAYREFRRRLSGGDPPAVCAGCSLYRRAF
ncbi:MAG TPA: SPASM domain-containing protein, partial [Actinoplanes sp.]